MSMNPSLALAPSTSYQHKKVEKGLRGDSVHIRTGRHDGGVAPEAAQQHQPR